MKRYYPLCTAALLVLLASASAQVVKPPFVPSQQELDRPFGKEDEVQFRTPPLVDHPETWFHFIGGNVSKAGITKDLEAIAQAGFSGVQLFHGQFGGPWPGVAAQITSLSANWDDAVKHTAQECRRLGLNFSMNNCPGWATSGGPWITPANAMRTIVWSRTDVTGGQTIRQNLPMPQPSTAAWRDYKPVAVLAFPTPLGDSGKPLVPQVVKSNVAADWKLYVAGKAQQAIHLPPADTMKPYWVEVNFDTATIVRSVEFSSIQAFNHAQAYDPGVRVVIQAVLAQGQIRDILQVNMPQANWQDDQPITLACDEVPGVKTYRIIIYNKHDMALGSLRLFSAARKDSWESEAGWTLRSLERAGQHPKQSPQAFINAHDILDISGSMDSTGHLQWTAPKGAWTILRIGHVNAGRQNGPAPKEGTGWEANKLAASGAEAHFAGYIGRLSGQQGPLAGGLLNGMLIDSWECHTQTWTPDMEANFQRVSHYPLRQWLPALFGYVIKDPETTGRFLIDWRNTVNELFTHNYYGRMATLARKNGLYVSYETSAGDIIPGDILEYYKYADVPMAEFWQPMSDAFVGSLNFKPIKPTVSAARMYGKPRVAAESFTNMTLSWDEHFDMLREVANCNTAEGVTHYVFHTYTHNPQTPFIAPGSSFGAGIGTPFLRGQTWWPYMPYFTNYLARCTYMLERGKPVSDVLWYLGDEVNHKPNQLAPFPEGFKYDYCNPDVLINRLMVKNGLLVTPEGIEYRVLWLPDAPRMLPQTLAKINTLVKAGATIVGEAPVGLATLAGGDAAQLRFNAAVKSIWGTGQTGIRKNGKGYVVSGITLQQALAALHIPPDVTGGDALWVHRKTAGADWYFISAPKGKGFGGQLSFRTAGAPAYWDPITGTTRNIPSYQKDGRTVIDLDLAQSNACFIVFSKKAPTQVVNSRDLASIPIAGPWTLHFPAGWGAPDTVRLTELKAWNALDLSPAGKAFSGTATYTTTFTIDSVLPNRQYILNLGRVDMVATVAINGTPVGNVLAPPYQLSVNTFLHQGQNTLTVAVTSTWFNRLVYDAGIPEDQRKTWTIDGPDPSATLQATGLIGPVTMQVKEPAHL
ncbi:alpha-L-rhamnosidase [Chitinophaga costaii]|uniref:Alpha-L-rhamnosidase n=1 Tax=Chitinophaga costaii TaxID=1335309 RepID=A0A1C3YPE9_9BACT|nr:glycosyl hydrolase [Chitinophaga costaii]PUZ30039.1 hypothetical protein DCM91_00735 [Chitinophaga costaii]SCB71976.1 alpha-L-rhamnosidase [Chitinophaga costaii]